MNIVFFGTSEFAMPALKALLESRHKVLALVTQPDRKRGRNLKLSPPPTKVLALERNIPVYQPLDASSYEAAEHLRKVNADLFVVISFGQILKKEILSLPRLYCLNVHGALLPKYRGAAPTNWAIINGEEKSGVTVIKMNEKMDEGDVILARGTKIDAEDTNITLSEELSELGASALLEAIEMIEKGKADFKPQDHLKATYAPKLTKKDGLIDWDMPAARIHNRVRGLIPWPSAYTHYEGKILKVLQTEILTQLVSRDAKTGQVVDIVKNEGIIVHTGSGDLTIKYLQLEGKKVLDADAFVRGHQIPKGYIFSK